MSFRNSSLAAALGLLGLACAPAAFAADLDAPLDPALDDTPQVMSSLPQSNVVFGSGWYIRGDLGGTEVPALRVSTPALPTQTNQIVPQAPPATLGNSSRLGYDGSLGAGYQYNTWIRGDVVADFHQPLATSSISGNQNVFCPTGVSYSSTGSAEYANGGCTGYYQAALKSFDVLVNGYVDLGTWSRITPYVGAGIGLSFGHYQTSATYIQANGIPYQVSYTDTKFNTTYYNDYDRSSSGTYYNFAWALMAGISVDVYDHTKLDIGYRYLNLGPISGVTGNLKYNEVRAGLRYMIDN